ncbi:MAG: pyridoxal phosphate-dependent decarboxylase family protein [Candidatus Omnitrophota bacterium]
MNELLNDVFDPESFRKNGHQLVDLLADYLLKARNGGDFPVLPWKAPEEMEARLTKDFHGSGAGDTEAAFTRFCSEVIENSFHFHHPGNMGHQVAVPAPMASLVDFMGNVLNNSMAIYEVGPFSSVAEKVVMDWLGEVLGMGKRSGGVLTSGGSIGNLTALLAARQNKAGDDVWEQGNWDRPPLAVMVSSESHYSVARAVKIMGWGEKGIVKVPVNDRSQIDPDALEETYRQAIRQGRQVIGVVANACSTSTGSYDPLDAIADFCRDKNLWLHVDGAHGGGAVLTSKYKHLVRGIEKADSVVVDFHKMLLCPALTTAVIFKNGDNAYETFSQKASYLLSADKRASAFDIAQRTLECTKKMMGIKVYALLKIYGVRLFEAYITRVYDMAAEFAALIRDSADFELALEPTSNILCFRYVPAFVQSADLRVINQLNIDVREKVKEDGNFYIVRTLVHDAVYLRSTLMNPFTSREDLVRLLQRIRELGPAGR